MIETHKPAKQNDKNTPCTGCCYNYNYDTLLQYLWFTTPGHILLTLNCASGNLCGDGGFLTEPGGPGFFLEAGVDFTTGSTFTSSVVSAVSTLQST